MALDTYALISLAEYKDFVRITDADEDTLLEELINRASADIEGYLHRNIKSRAYVNERYDGGGNEIFLKNYPVTALVQVCHGTENVIRVRCTDTTARNAYVSVDADAEEVKLMRDGSTDATHDLSSLTTMTALATAMNAISGWTATLLGSEFAQWPTSELFTQPNRYCRQEDAELQVPYEPMAGVEVDLDSGIVKAPTNEDFLNVFISYTAGYATVPDYAALFCCRLVAFYDNLRKRDETLKSEKAPDYAWTAADFEKLYPDMMSQINRMRRPLV